MAIDPKMMKRVGYVPRGLFPIPFYFPHADDLDTDLDLDSHLSSSDHEISSSFFATQEWQHRIPILHYSPETAPKYRRIDGWMPQLDLDPTLR